MTRFHVVLSLFVLTVGLAGCRSTPSPSEAANAAAWMTGSFSSAAQAAEQPDDYYDIRLHMVPIWTERDDGHWLYVEQAAASSLERPYRQRIYRVVDTSEGVRSDVFTLPGNPLDYAGAWRTPEVFAGLSPDVLILRDGCSIYLTGSAAAGRFEGATRGTGCVSHLGTVAYATSEVVLTPDRIVSWDRGFDSEGKQAWGAVKGGYEFVKAGLR